MQTRRSLLSGRHACRILLIVCGLWGGGAQAQNPSPAESCRTDLEALPGFLLENDAGAREHVARRGQAVFDAALAKARVDVAGIDSDADCVKLLRGYLRSYRHGHLGVSAIAPSLTVPAAATPDASLPSFRVLSAKTALLVLPSFADHYAEPIGALLRRHAREIAARPNLIVDVRRNGGGSDTTYEPVMALIDANLRRDVGAEFLSTPANIEASQAVCEQMQPPSQACRDFMRPVLEAMRAAPVGSFVLPTGIEPVATVRPRQIARQPQRVAVVIDRGCGSSCEEFVLAARQSFKVKLFGRPTYGSLDYSNMRPHTLPSGLRRLHYATSRSLRLPAYAIDAGGIAPDHFMLKPAEGQADEELRYVQQVLESTR
ncbi:S41 family peptidase [Caldimonas sp. KR1-144]|uniref:S41 family peptidase n=1 Tax=Caldimonas sp. KR1-144 TaxID=3400911 RepID=UPI003C0A16FB